MNPLLLEGSWKNKNHHLNIKVSSPNLIVTDSSIIPTIMVNGLIYTPPATLVNGVYYPVTDGIMFNFSLSKGGSVISYVGKIYEKVPKFLYIETLTILDNPIDYFKQDLWSLYDACEHENIILTRQTPVGSAN